MRGCDGKAHHGDRYHDEDDNAVSRHMVIDESAENFFEHALVRASGETGGAKSRAAHVPTITANYFRY